MIRFLLALLLLMVAPPLSAQDGPTPIVETKLEKTEVVPGQTLILRLNVLVPTWMPSPPDLPSFEAPNLRVREPTKGGTAISQLVNGETWSGVSRRYLLTPMVPGQIVLPPQEVRLTYVGPDGTTPVEAVLTTEPVTITGTLPEGAEGLDPFIAADALSLTQELSGPTTGLEPGASVIRKLTATIEGASPIVLPPMLPQFDLPAIRTYPASPDVTENSGEEAMSGTRVESETLMALGGGSGSAPPVKIDWYNLKTGKVESAEVPGFDISVIGPPPKSDTPRKPPNWRLILPLAAAIFMFMAFLRWLWPRAQHGVEAHRNARLASEGHAKTMLLAAISRRDYPQTTHWLAEWRARLTEPDATDLREVAEQMAGVGATIYRDASAGDGAWRGLANSVQHVGGGRKRSLPLPELNPKA